MNQNTCLNSLFLAVLLALPQAVLAQSTTGNDWNRVKAVVAGEELVVVFKDGKEAKGCLSQVTDTALTLARGKRAPTDIEQGQIRQVYRLQSRSGKKAALIGLAVGGGIGTGIGGKMVSGGGESGEYGPIFMFGIAGAGFGALGGYLLSRGKKQVLIFEAR